LKNFLEIFKCQYSREFVKINHFSDSLAQKSELNCLQTPVSPGTGPVCLLNLSIE
jgi:hypothetical protein